ncbi:hypothetical protein COV20_05580 [Candidatus Woesearchaeota archaeon CG10_big_fil_rev_8_21_14_0_10_45_16]|nr:MAG: hypothetical protein COV20_05580 [Candidatus Woesearchaeota archaeon CG10_big_fil_rev_8_21_14_0_10_45_16]
MAKKVSGGSTKVKASQKPAAVELSLFQQLKMLIIKPADFFTQVAPEKSLGQTLLFDAVQSFVGLLPLALFYSFLFTFLSFGSLTVPLFVVGLPVITVLFNFIVAGVSHLILKIAGAQGNYLDTYRAQIYSVFPSAVGMFFFIIGGGLLGFYSYYLQIVGFAKMHKISYLRAAAPLITYVVLGLIIAVFMLSFFVAFVARSM